MLEDSNRQMKNKVGLLGSDMDKLTESVRSDPVQVSEPRSVDHEQIMFACAQTALRL